MQPRKIRLYRAPNVGPFHISVCYPITEVSYLLSNGDECFSQHRGCVAHTRVCGGDRRTGGVERAAGDSDTARVAVGPGRGCGLRGCAGNAKGTIKTKEPYVTHQ